MTIGVGSTLFDGRYGLASLKPQHLAPLRALPSDDLNPAWVGVDLLVQPCALQSTPEERWQSGYFFALPGVKVESDWYGRGVLA